MGTVGFDNGRKNKIVPRMLLNDCVAVNTASVPKKLRSAMKKRGRESITPPLPISKKQHHLSSGIEKPRKEGAKKSKLNTKKGRITKDEKEVAETLYALADLFSDATKANQPGLDDEPPQTKSSTLLEDPRNVTSRKKSRKTSSKVIREAAHHSSDLLDSTSQVVVLQSLGDTQQPEVHFSEQPSTSSASGVKPDLSLDPRQKLSTVDITPSCEQAIALERVVTTSEIQYGKHYYRVQDKSNGLYSFSATRTRIPETNRFGFENTNFASQPRVSENSVSADKNTKAVAKSDKSWKKCATQVYICRLIKVLQISNKNEGSLEKPTQLAACGGSEPRPHTSTHPQTRVINGRNGSVSFNGIKHFDGDKISGGIQNETLVHKRALQDQQLASEISVLCTSLKQGENYNFLSLDAKDRGLDDSEGINRTGHSHMAPHDSHASCVQLHNQSAMRSSVSNSSFYGHSSGLAAAQQVHFPTYSSSATNSGYTTHFLSQYNSGAKPYLPEWRSEETGSLSMLYTRALFPHLNSAIGSKFSLP